MTWRRVPVRLYGDYAGQLEFFKRVLPNGCWEFTGYVRGDTGYGQLGGNLLAHRVAWELANGRSVPEGRVIDHLCHDDNCPSDDAACPHRRCVNPDHLAPETRGGNVMRGRGVSPQNAAKTHCTQGHPFTQSNTYERPDRPGRMCRTCRREADRRYRKRVAA